MRWFFALNENSPGFWDYANLVQVAVHSARTKTRLRPVCIYDGGESRLTAWLRAAGVQVVFRRTQLAALGLPLSAIARGAYLRLEIPAIMAETGWSDDYVLYTDCDVLFARDPVPLLQNLKPRVFAVAPESDPTDQRNFNSGVMLINVRAFRREVPGLVGLVRERPAECLSAPYDQRALQIRLGESADALPRELNWKSYWPSNPAAAIIHFHGPKPAQRYLILNRLAPPDLLACSGPSYFDWCRVWDENLLAALAAMPWPAPAPAEAAPDGFAGLAGGADGLGPEEGPFPQWMLPVVRWGFHPRTIINLPSPASVTRQLTLSAQCPYADQRMHVSLNGTRLGTIAFERVSEPVAAHLPLELQPGENILVFDYERNFAQPGDTRALAVLFRTLRIDPGQ